MQDFPYTRPIATNTRSKLMNWTKNCYNTQQNKNIGGSAFTDTENPTNNNNNIFFRFEKPVKHRTSHSIYREIRYPIYIDVCPMYATHTHSGWNTKHVCLLIVFGVWCVEQVMIGARCSLNDLALGIENVFVLVYTVYSLQSISWEHIAHNGLRAIITTESTNSDEGWNERQFVIVEFSSLLEYLK